MGVKNLWTKRNILDYLRNPSADLDKNYIPIRQKYRQEFRKMDKRSRALGTTTDWNYILNDFM